MASSVESLRKWGQTVGEGGAPVGPPVDPSGADQIERPVVTGGVSSYLEQLTQRRDAQAAMKMPRSQGSWDAEQRRPGSWHSGQGRLASPGVGRQYTSGVGRPLIQQRGL